MGGYNTKIVHMKWPCVDETQKGIMTHELVACSETWGHGLQWSSVAVYLQLKRLRSRSLDPDRKPCLVEADHFLDAGFVLLPLIGPRLLPKVRRRAFHF